MSDNKILIISGPTGTGKTKFAVNLLKSELPGEIISADSRQVFKGLDCISNKIKPGQSDAKIQRGLGYWSQDGVRINGYDLVALDQEYSVNQFVEDNTRLVEKLWSENRIPVIVGGTGYYIDALLGLRSFSNIPPNSDLRKDLGKLDIINLRDQLARLDYLGLNSLSYEEQQNKRRLIRYIEIATATGSIEKGKVFSALKDQLKDANNIYYAYLKDTHLSLYSLVDQWLTLLLNSSQFVLELQGLLSVDSLSSQLANGLIIREGLRFLHEEIAMGDVYEICKGKLHNYIRRQLTWFNQGGSKHIFTISSNNSWIDFRNSVLKWYDKN